MFQSALLRSASFHNPNSSQAMFSFACGPVAFAGRTCTSWKANCRHTAKESSQDIRSWARSWMEARRTFLRARALASPGSVVSTEPAGIASRTLRTFAMLLRSLVTAWTAATQNMHSRVLTLHFRCPPLLMIYRLRLYCAPVLSAFAVFAWLESSGGNAWDCSASEPPPILRLQFCRPGSVKSMSQHEALRTANWRPRLAPHGSVARQKDRLSNSTAP